MKIFDAMKNIFPIAAILSMFISCSDIKELNDRMDVLENRVAVLEVAVSALNSNAEALYALMNAQSISSVTEKDGVYTIIMSNGQEITLTQGSVGYGIVPVMSIDSEGYWMVDYGDGSVYLMYDGAKIPATGKDGQTPLFSVDEDGFWLVSYDSGKTYTHVLDVNSEKVSALGTGESADQFFNDVRLGENGDVLEIVMRNGEMVTVPVVPDFLCCVDASGMQVFRAGQTKTFMVTAKGVSTIIISAPEGWGTAYSENILSITAPDLVSPLTKSLSANNMTDVSLLAISETGFVAVAKVEVMVEGGESGFKPQVALAVDEITSSSVLVTAALSADATWKYLLLRPSDISPSAERVNETGEEAEGTSLLIGGLSPGTSYVLYAIALKDGIIGNVQSIAFTTEAMQIDNWYDWWTAGNAIVIGGVEYDYETYKSGTVMHVTEDYTIKSGDEWGVYFVDPGAKLSIGFSNSCRKLIVVGNNPGVRSEMEFTTRIQPYEMGDPTGVNVFGFKNMTIDTTPFNDYLFLVNNAKSFGRMVFDGCKLIMAKTLVYMSSSDKAITDFTMVDTDVEIRASNLNFLGTGSSTATYGSMTFRNNVFYASSGTFTNFYLFNGGNSSFSGDIVFERNTMVNLAAHSNSYLYAKVFNGLSATDNIFYYTDVLTNATCLVRSTDAWPSYGEVTHNISYRKNAGNAFQVIYGGKGNWFSAVDEAVDVDTDPFGTFDQGKGIFVQHPDYSSFGAIR